MILALSHHSQLLFPYCSTKCHAAYKVFNLLHDLAYFLTEFFRGVHDAANKDKF